MVDGLSVFGYGPMVVTEGHLQAISFGLRPFYDRPQQMRRGLILCPREPASFGRAPIAAFSREYNLEALGVIRK